MNKDITYLKNKQIIVKSNEEECGEEYFIVTVPDNMSDEELDRILHMAAEYATVDVDLDELEGKEAYDEHYEEMCNQRENGNGQDVFNYYLKKFGCKVKYLKADFAYEW